MAQIISVTHGQPLSTGTVVVPAEELVGLQSPSGELLPPERLGPGLVRQICDDGVLVRWLGAGFDSWVSYQDLRLLGRDAHLVAVYKCDRKGNCKLVRHRVALDIGFEHNWTAELRPPDVVRLVRDDGCVWTFTYNHVFNRIDTQWFHPPEDEDAEALTAAELAALNRRYPL
jgi:hypothetical protein